MAGLILSTTTCRTRAKPSLEFVSVSALNHFPSASAIEYDKGRLFVFGDDASYLLVLDTTLKTLDTVQYVHDTSFRIDRSIKPDIESASILHTHDGDKLYALGSLSAQARTSLFYFPANDIHHYLKIDFSSFKKTIQGIDEWNIEGMAIVNNRFVLGNRANSTHRTNKLILTNGDFINDAAKSESRVIDFNWTNDEVVGISGLFYDPDADRIWISLSEEDTPSATADGEIKNSYIAWIDDFSTALFDRSVGPSGVVNLSRVHPSLIRQKIESLCIVPGKSVKHMFLVSDDDNGHSNIFKLKIRD